MSKATSMDRAISSIFVLGSTESRYSQDNTSRASEPIDLASLSREELGGIEYRALRVLLKIAAGTYLPKMRWMSQLTAVGYFFGLHLFGVICLIPWIHTADAKYKDYLASLGQDKTWWYVLIKV